MAVALVLAAVYAAAVIAKRQSRRRFADYVRPLTRHGTALYVTTVVLELALVMLLCSAAAAPSTRGIAGDLSIAFLLTATATHAALLARRAPTTCHCFGRISASSRRLDPAWQPALFALRNGTLAALSLVLAHASPGEIGAAAMAIAALVALGLLAGIMRERALMRRDTHPTAELYGPGMRTLMAHIWWVDGHPRAF